MNNKYYKDNAIEFFNSTVDVDMNEQYHFFLKYFYGQVIIDLGCGSGRDSKFFKDLGYEVISIDFNEAFKPLAKEKLDVDIIIQDIKNIAYTNIDGIWACASLLHLNSFEVKIFFQKLSSILNESGIMYCSFKLGTYEGERNGRYFNDMTIDKISKYLGNLKIIDSYISDDVRANRKEEKWLNLIICK